MKFQPGDTVLILHSNEEGEVIEIINAEMILVEVAGIRFPVYTDQVDFPYFKRFTEKKIVQKKKKVYIDEIKKEKAPATIREHEGVRISFLPVFDKDIFEDDIVEKIKIYLINQTSDSLNFNYQISFKGNPGFHLSNQVQPFTHFYLHDIPFEEMNDAPRFEFDFSLAEPDRKKADHFETSIKIKAKQWFSRFEEIKMKNEPSFSFLLFEHYPDKIKEVYTAFKPSPKYYNSTRATESLEPPRSVVDLHIEKLTDNWKGLNNFEILTIQLRSFEKYYQLAVAHHQPNLIIIHGVGSGKLRNEIHEILKTKKEVRTFANQYHPDFGFGATEIFFQY